MDDKTPDPIIETLSKFVKIKPKEKYPESVGKHMVFSSIDEILGKNFSKERISERKVKKIYDLILEKMRARYGSWVNLLDFKIKGDIRKISFSTNFEKIYNTEMGNLFGTANSSPIWQKVLFTSHSLERFEERAKNYSFTGIKKSFGRVCRAQPTSADILLTLIFYGDYDYAPLAPTEYYLSVKIGACVMETFDDVTVVKTFVSPKMVKNVTWFRPTLTDEQSRSPSKHFSSLKQILKNNYTKVSPPNWENLSKEFENENPYEGSI